MSTEQTNIKVVVRVRPYNKRELEQNQRSIIKVVDSRTLLFDPEQEDDEFFFQGSKQNYRDITKRVNKKLPMDFDRVFDIDNVNKDIFEECTMPLVDAVLNGYNCSVFVYGATGAGKTFTMLGSEACPGLTFLTMRDLFEKIESQQDIRKFDVGVSYLEVYNEQVMNLLTKTGPLKLREDSSGVVVSGLVLKPIYSAEELLRMLVLGNANRTQHPTDANAESSRSHAVFQVHIRMTERKTGTKRTVKLSMIDLAGSERAASTKGVGVRFKEGASINKSLLALGNCINKLADGLKHIPYRDSNLTRLLKDSLGGNCRTLMVANVSMSSLTYEDTYNTLKYASRAKKIRTTLRQNVMKSNMPKEFYVRKVNDLTAENERLIERNKILELKIAQLEKSSTRSCYDEAELMPWYTKIDTVYSSLLKTMVYVDTIRSKIKTLIYRQTLKTDFENFRKILAINQRAFHEDFACFSTYISNLKNQCETQEQELPRWRNKLQDAYRDLGKLKREVKESKQAQILQTYMNCKDLEVKNSKQNNNNNFLRSINSELFENTDNLARSFENACEVLKQLYDNLESTQKLTPDIHKFYEKLLRHMSFQSNEDVSRNENDIEVLDADRPLNSSEDDDDAVSASASSLSKTITIANDNKKRQRPMWTSHRNFDFELEADSMDDESDSTCVTEKQVFKKPRKLNDTHVVSCADDEYSSGFETSTSVASRKPSAHMQTSALQPCKSRTVISRRFVADVLSDQNVRSTANREKIKQALLKSNSFNQHELQRTMAVAVQKENLKMNSNCVRKSPRALIAKAHSGTTTLARKQVTSRLAGIVGGSKDAPQVRINRAASFRVKK